MGLLFGYNISDGMSLMKTALLAWRKRLWNRKFSSTPRILCFRNPGNRYPKTNPIMEIGCRCCYWHLNFFHAFTALIDQAGIKMGVQISRGQHRAVAQPNHWLPSWCAALLRMVRLSPMAKVLRNWINCSIEYWINHQGWTTASSVS